MVRAGEMPQIGVGAVPSLYKLPTITQTAGIISLIGILTETAVSGMIVTEVSLTYGRSISSPIISRVEKY